MMVSELAFVAGPTQNPRLVDLAEALALEVRELGLAATIEREAIPARKAGRVSVVLDPPRLAVGRRGRPPAARELAGAIPIWAGLGRDDRNAAGPGFDLDLASARARRARGERVEPLSIGQVADLVGAARRRARHRSGGDRGRRRAQRPAARRGGRRAQPLAGRDRRHRRPACARRARGYTRPRVSGGRCSRGSKLVLDLARRRPPRLDALRAAEAVCAGAVLVREDARPLATFEPGAHYVDGGRRPIAAALELLGDPQRRRELQAAAADAAAIAPLRGAAEALIEAAGLIAARGPRRAVSLAPARDLAGRRPAPDHLRSRLGGGPTAAEARPAGRDRTGARARAARRRARRRRGRASGRARQPGGGGRDAAGLGAGHGVRLRGRDRRGARLGRRRLPSRASSW